MAEISEMLFSRPALEALEGVVDHVVNAPLGDLHSLGFNVTIPTEHSAAGRALKGDADLV